MRLVKPQNAFINLIRLLYYYLTCYVLLTTLTRKLPEVPLLPQHLQNLPDIGPDLFQEPWDIFSHFLLYYGYTLANTPAYDAVPTSHVPSKLARDPFHPKDGEAFTYNKTDFYLKHDNYFQMMSQALNPHLMNRGLMLEYCSR